MGTEFVIIICLSLFFVTLVTITTILARLFWPLIGSIAAKINGSTNSAESKALKSRVEVLEGNLIELSKQLKDIHEEFDFKLKVIERARLDDPEHK